MIMFLLCRQKGTGWRRDQVFRCQTDVVTFIQQTSDCYRLINDYLQRPAMVMRFREKVSACNKAVLSSNVYNITNGHFAPFITTSMCAIYVVFSYQKVLD